jgi:hypothetical protein
MRIHNEQTALEWLHAWGNKPSHGTLVAAIEGLERVASICKEYGHKDELAGAYAALTVLRTHHLERCAKK